MFLYFLSYSFLAGLFIPVFLFATMICHGTYKVIYDDKAKFNPFKVYHIADGHKKLVEKYADLGSAMEKLARLAVMWGTIERIY